MLLCTTRTPRARSTGTVSTPHDVPTPHDRAHVSQHQLPRRPCLYVSPAMPSGVCTRGQRCRRTAPHGGRYSHAAETYRALTDLGEVWSAIGKASKRPDVATHGAGLLALAPQLYDALHVSMNKTANTTSDPGTRHEPFNSTPMAVNSISSGSPHVLRAHMGVHRTCGA